MNMPPPGGQPPPGGPPQQPQGQPPGQPGGQPQGQNPIVQSIQTLGQFVERLAQRNPAAGKAAAQHLQAFIQVIKSASGGGPGEAKEGAQPPEEETRESPDEAKQEMKPQGKKKMGPMPMNAKPGAQQVL